MRKPIDEPTFDMSCWIREVVVTYYRIGRFSNDTTKFVDQ